MTRQRTSLKYFLVALLVVVLVASLIVAAACGTKRTITWNIGDHATVTVEGEKNLPNKAKDGDTIVFTVATDAGYVVDEVLRDNKPISANKQGKYTVSISADVTIAVTTKLEVSGIKVTQLPTKLNYLVGERVDKAGMKVVLEHGSNDPEEITDYYIRYQTKNASSFQLGDEGFYVYVDDQVSDLVKLSSPVAAQITLDLQGGEVAKEYVTALQENEALTVDDATEGKLFIRFSSELSDNIPLPTKAQMSKGEVQGDYTFNYWQCDDDKDKKEEDDDVFIVKDGAISKTLVNNVEIVANWNNHLADITGVNLVVDEGVHYLVVSGTFVAAKSLSVFLLEGNRGAYYMYKEVKEGNRGESFELRADLTELLTAVGQDGKNFFGAWLDVRVAYQVDGRVETTEAPQDMSFEKISMDDENGEYNYSITVWNGWRKVVVSLLSPTTYRMSVDNANDVLTLTFDGQLKEKLVDACAGGKVVIDWWIGKTVASEAIIAEDGSWQIVFTLSPEKGFALNTVGYAHVKVYDKNNNVIFGEEETNLSPNELTNRDEFSKIAVPNGEIRGNLAAVDSLEISNAAGTLVYYPCIANWEAIVIFGYDPTAPEFTVSGDVELRVDNMENPTKVYYLVKFTVVKNMTADDVFAIMFGNIDGGEINVYSSDRNLSTVKGNVYTLWFDITSYSGGQLWPNLYMPKPVDDGAERTADDYEKLKEIKDGSRKSNGLYAIVGETKYLIKCDSSTWDSPCIFIETPAENEKNPDAVNPTPKEIEIDKDFFNLVEEDGKVYVVVKITAINFADINDIKASIKYGDVARDFTWLTDCVKIEEDGEAYKLWFDVTEMKMGTDGKLWSGLYIGEKKHEVKVNPAIVEEIDPITLEGIIYTVVCSQATYGIPCLITKEVGTPEYAITSVDIVLGEDSKVYFVIGGTYANYDEDELSAMLTAVYFDFQENGFINGGYDWNGSWNSFDKLAREVKLLDGVITITFDVTDLGLGAYGAHLGQVEDGQEEDGTPKMKAVDFKLDYTSIHGKYVIAGERRYALYNFYGTGNANFHYGCVGLRIFADENFYEATDATLEADDNDAYLVIKGVYKGYEEDALKEAITSAVFDLQQNQNAGASGWNSFTEFDKVVTVNTEDGTWEMKIKITSLDANPYTTHFGGGVRHNNGNSLNDFVLPNKANDGTAVTAAGKRFTIVNRFGSGEGSDFWGCIGIVVTNVTE